MNELQFRRQLVGSRGLAERLGWDHVGWRPAMTTAGWRTPGTGTLAIGWPDLTLVHARSGRLLFVELKGDGGKLRPDQERVLDVLRTVEAANQAVGVHVWHPSEYDTIEAVLR